MGTHTIRLTGRTALATAERLGMPVSHYATAIDTARTCVAVDDELLQEIAAEDLALIYLDVPVAAVDTGAMYLLRVPSQLPADLHEVDAADVVAIRRWEAIGSPIETADLDDADASATHTAEAWRCHDLHAYVLGTLTEIADYRGHQQERVPALLRRAIEGT